MSSPKRQKPLPAFPLDSDCLSLVAEHIEPRPADLYRLATVNKLFYQVFMSDHVWRYLNAYNVDKDIARTVLEHCDMRDLEFLYYWSKFYQMSKGNRFAKLGTLAMGRNWLFEESPAATPGYNHLVECAVHHSAYQNWDAPVHIANNVKLCKTAILVHGCSIQSFSGHLRDNKELAMLALSVPCLKGRDHQCKTYAEHSLLPNRYVRIKRPGAYRFLSPRLQTDPEVLEKALATNPLNYLYLPKTLDAEAAKRLMDFKPRAGLPRPDQQDSGISGADIRHLKTLAPGLYKYLDTAFEIGATRELDRLLGCADDYDEDDYSEDDYDYEKYCCSSPDAYY